MIAISWWRGFRAETANTCPVRVSEPRKYEGEPPPGAHPHQVVLHAPAASERSTRSCCSLGPRHIGALGNRMIGESGALHQSLDRWFTRSVHSTEAQSPAPTLPIGQLRRSVGPQPAFSLSEEPAAREPQPRPPALAPSTAAIRNSSVLTLRRGVAQGEQRLLAASRRDLRETPRKSRRRRCRKHQT
jgi:hypothetical protein